VTHWSSAVRSAAAAAAQASVLVLPVAIESGELWVVLDAASLEIEPVQSVDPLRPVATCGPTPWRSATTAC
jgi:hypothetical protein